MCLRYHEDAVQAHERVVICELPQSSNCDIFSQKINWTRLTVPKIITQGVTRTRVRIMQAQECRENAEECLEWARTAKSDREQEIFLQMAETWLAAAARLERTPVIFPPNGPTCHAPTIKPSP